MSTKHEQIIRHIITLKVGSKISVRQVARELNVSDGTAYRAIKEAENQGLVSTIERVGTIRIERKKKENFESLTFAEVINVVDGQVLGGRNGLHKTLNKFVIGAMKLDAMMRYTEADSLLIVGNRIKAHELALEAGAAVLITGGFGTDDHVKRLADKKNLPIMTTSYDTFTVAAMINRAIYDQLIKKEIVFVGDIATPLEDTFLLNLKDTVQRWYDLNELTSHTRFPVVDNDGRISGMITPKDVISVERDLLIKAVMTKNPQAVKEMTSLAYVAHMMVWEGIELIPVVDGDHNLQGIVSRQDVLKALQEIQRQPQMGDTLEDVISSNLKVIDENNSVFQSEVIPQMTNQLGTISSGVFTTLIAEASNRLLFRLNKGDMVVESVTIYFIKPVQIESQLIIKPRLLEAGRIYAKIDVEITHDNKLVGKGLLTVQLIDR